MIEKEEEIVTYIKGKFSELENRKSSTELEILEIINSLSSFHLYIQNDKFTIKTNWKNIIEFYNKVQKKNFEMKSLFLNKRWIYFLEVIAGT